MQIWKRIFIDNKSGIHSYLKFFEALPFALNESTNEIAAINKPKSITKCKFIINVIYDW